MNIVTETGYLEFLQKVVDCGQNETAVVRFDADSVTRVKVKRIVVYVDSSSEYDPMEDRRASWRRIFGSKPMPEINPNAAEEYSGSLGKGLNLTRSEIEEVFEQMDEE